MPKFTFKRTMVYTEVVTVTADSRADAKELAHAAEGERNNDDIAVDLQLIKQEEGK